MDIVIFYVPFGSADSARSCGEAAIQEKLAACINTSSATSVYPWEGELQRDAESILILKTVPERAEALADFLNSRHPYDTPAIVQWPARVNDRYGAWMRSVLGETKHPD